MKRIILFSCVFTMLLSTGISAQSFKQKLLVSGEWITDWLLCGPFDLVQKKDVFAHCTGFETDYLKKSGGEQSLKVKAGDVVKFKGGSNKWNFYTSPENILNLDRAVSTKEPAFAYAYTEVYAEEPGFWKMAFGSNDGGRLWVNGQQLWDYAPNRGIYTDQDVFPVLLNKGKNTILFKIEEKGGMWRLALRFFPIDGSKMEEKNTLLNLNYQKDGTIGLTSLYSPDQLTSAINQIHLQVSEKGIMIVDEELQGDFLKRIKLKSAFYRPLDAVIDVTLRNGIKLHAEQKLFVGERIVYPLFKNGASAYAIVLGSNASESEQFAAKELQDCIKQGSGVLLPIKSTQEVHDGGRIILGFNEAAQSLGITAAPSAYDESFVYASVGGDILIYGGSQRGTMYGVFSFLERELGVRWYTSRVTDIPQRSSYQFDELYHTEKPGIRVRNDFYFDAFNPLYAAHNRINGAMGNRDQHGGVEGYWGVHTFYGLVPPDTYFETHPEYYSLIDGKRTHDHAQLCLTNPDVLRIAIENIKEIIRSNPQYLIYDVSQNDCLGYCTCDQCKAISEAEGSESGLMIWFVNQVAAAIEKEFPDKYIGTLAYVYTRKPPKTIHPRKNVVVRLCSIECCFSHDLHSCPQNASFIKDLEEWGSIAPNMYIWDYAVSFADYLSPFPNFNVLQPNIKDFQKNNAIGIMEEADFQSDGGEFAELRAYVFAKLLWNPDLNYEELLNDFMYGYYGHSGMYIRQYFDLVQGLVTKDVHVTINMSVENTLFTNDFLNKALDLFEKAEKVANSDELIRRVELASIGILYMKCIRTPVLAREDGTYEKFSRIVEREKVINWMDTDFLEKTDAFHRMIKNAH
ncbi:MAG: DUF4838 domain-containing protein [Bacteroidota bacterium]|nr:DUF4838 domain-containing protein [Bacteroidota bacterium]